MEQGEPSRKGKHLTRRRLQQLEPSESRVRRVRLHPCQRFTQVMCKVVDHGQPAGFQSGSRPG
jgi:hypothetical protein